MSSPNQPAPTNEAATASASEMSRSRSPPANNTRTRGLTDTNRDDQGDDIEHQWQLQGAEVDGAEGGEGGTATRSLHGLEKSMSGLDHAANFSDYIKAQRSLSSMRRRQSHRDLNRTSVFPGQSAIGAGSTSLLAVQEEQMQEEEEQRQRVSGSSPPTTSKEERKTIKRLSLIGRRRASTVNAAEMEDKFAWDNIFNELAAIDEDGHFHDGDEHVIPWYFPPLQRQRWGQDQILPHVNWGDLFFDLFYVAAAYNLGVMLTSAMNHQDWPRGVIYLVGIFGPMWTAWETSMYYESRYTKVDYAHRLFEAVRFLFVSLAVLHIKPLELLSDPKSMEAFLFILGILLESIMHLGLNCELYYKGQGDVAAIQNHTLVKVKYQLLPTILMYLAALIVAAVQFAQPTESEPSDYNNSSEYTKASTTYNRLLGPATNEYADYEKYEEKKPRWVLSDLPLTLTALAYLLNIFHTTWRKLRVTSANNGDIRQNFVPNNIDYVIHRYGEWIMLMIGEGVLSLLIVETTESKDYYIITTFGVLTVILLQILKFESEPSHAETHALWRSMRNSMSYGYLIQILSMGLIAFGVSYKVFLNAVVETEEKVKETDYGYDGNSPKRMLAPAVEVSDKAYAALFTGSLSVVLISLELMTLCHKGIKKAVKLLLQEVDAGQSGGDRKRRPYWPMIVISTFKLGVVLFTLTLNQWTVDPAVLALCGFAIVASLALTRILGWGFIHHKQVIDQAITSTVQSVRNLKKAVSFGPSTSAAGEKALATSNHSTGSVDGEKRSESGSVSSKVTSGTSGTSSTDLVSGGINNSFDAIVVADLMGIIKQVNTTAVAIFGYATREEMVGKNLTIIVGGGEGKNHDAYMKGFRQKNASKTSKVVGRQRMLHARRADGTEFPCIIGIKMCANDTRIVGYIRDMSGVVTDKKSKLRTDLNETEAIERVVDDHAFDAIIASDSHGIIQRVNETAVTEFGYDKKR